MFLGRVRYWICAFAASAVVFTVPNVLHAIDIVSVEEHWELRVGEPDENCSAPQVTMTMSPTGDLHCWYFVFTLNHHSEPEYAPGGLQVQSWHDEDIENSRDGNPECALWQQGEVIRWTQRLDLEDGQLKFEIRDGHSGSWGNFGGCDLELHTSSGLANLNDYSPGLSIEESGVGYAGNRVVSLILTKLVWTTDDGETYEMTAPIDVDADLDP